MRVKTAMFAGVVLAAGTGSAFGDVLYDALVRDINDPLPYSSSYDRVWSTIGTANIFGDSYDLQGADDFLLTGAHTITSITVDFDSETGLMPSSLLVEIFADAGGKPGEAPFATTSVSSGDISTEVFGNPGDWGQTGSEPGYRTTADLSGAGIELGAGTWWVSVVSVTDDDFNNVFRVYEQATGGDVHYREGGVDHGNGFAGFYRWCG